MKLLFRLVIILALGIGGNVVWMVSHENEYIYFPKKEITQTPLDAGLSFHDIRFRTKDGVTLHGWYMPHKQARFTLLHMHGNAGNISGRLAQYRRWHALGLAVFAFDYRGYGKSGGTPSEAGLYADAEAAWLLLRTQHELASNRIIIAGRSLGAAVAAKLASEVKPAGLALEAPFTSIPDMSSAAYPWLPLRWFVHSRFNTEASVRSVQAPLLLISAKSDELIPFRMGDRVFAAARNPKLRGILAGGHNDFDTVSKHAWFKLWRQWLNSLKKAGDSPIQWVRHNDNKGMI